MSGNIMTVAFLGASTGIGLSALKHTLAAGHQCIALCRTPSKLTALFSTDTPNLKIVQGNAHDINAVSKCLQGENGKLVDAVISTIGGKPSMSGLTLGIDDPKVCGKGAATLLEAIAKLRQSGVQDNGTGTPHLVAVSSTGISRFGRDTPLGIGTIYHLLGKVPHADKMVMEDRLAEGPEAFTVIRASFLTNGESTKNIRVGIEDPKTGPESKAIGYTISREDAGKWISENLVLKSDSKYTNKFVVITY
jgi:NAD(P)-dependent dehydrogenase (short-subunit alcohol dehydrogenase family)